MRNKHISITQRHDTYFLVIAVLVSPYSLESVARFKLLAARLKMILTKAVHVRIEPINDLISLVVLYPTSLTKRKNPRIVHGMGVTLTYRESSVNDGGIRSPDLSRKHLAQNVC